MCINYALEQNQPKTIRSCALKPTPDDWQHGKQNAQFSLAPVIWSLLFNIMTLPFLVLSTSNLHVARV